MLDRNGLAGWRTTEILIHPDEYQDDLRFFYRKDRESAPTEVKAWGWQVHITHIFVVIAR